MSAQRLLTYLLLVGILAAAGVAALRTAVMLPRKHVELALSLQAVRESSVTQAFPFDEMLQRYKEAGVTTLLVSGTTLQRLLDYGATGYPAPVLLAVESGRVSVANNPTLAQWLKERLTARLGSERVRANGSEIQVSGLTNSELLSLDLGVYPGDLGIARVMGWQVAAQLSETQFGQHDGVLLDGLPAGTPVLWTGSVGPFIGAQEAMKTRGDLLLIDHSRPPFFEGMAPGVEVLFQRLGGRSLKLFRAAYSHSVADMLVAVKERQMQMVLVRPYHLTGDLRGDLAQQVGMWQTLVQELKAAGYTLDRGDALGFFMPPVWMLVLVGASVGAAAALLVGAPAALGVAVAALGAAVAMVPYDLTRQGMALAAACVLPALGAVRALDARGLVRRLGWLAGTAFGAGLLITALLANTAYAYEIELFRGIKVALVAPSAAFVAITAWRERAVLSQWWQGRSLQVWHLTVGLAVLLAVPLMLIRSGQDSEILLVSGLELKLRGVLEQLLVVRPRFKEFLIGWPLLILAHAALQRGCRTAGAALLAVGLVGPASLVNSFTHLHIPLWISAVRGLHGLWIGALLGGGALLILRGGERGA